MTTIDILLPGQPIAKKNNQIVRCINGKPIVIQSKAYREYEKKSLAYLLSLIPSLKVKHNLPLICPVKVKVLYYLANKRLPDLINLMQATADILEKAGIIDNDKLIHSWDGSRILGIDKINPRSEIYIEPLSSLN